MKPATGRVTIELSTCTMVICAPASRASASAFVKAAFDAGEKSDGCRTWRTGTLFELDMDGLLGFAGLGGPLGPFERGARGSHHPDGLPGGARDRLVTAP